MALQVAIGRGPDLSGAHGPWRRAQTVISGMGELHLRFLLIACSASSAWRPTLAIPKWPIARQSPEGASKRAVRAADRWCRPVRRRLAGTATGVGTGFQFVERRRRRVGIPRESFTRWKRVRKAWDTEGAGGLPAGGRQITLFDGLPRCGLVRNGVQHRRQIGVTTAAQTRQAGQFWSP